MRKTLHLLSRQGFVVREHRRERKQGDKVQSTAEYEEDAPSARTATYVSLDYPRMFDMLRLRLHLAKKAAADAIDDGSVRALRHCVYLHAPLPPDMRVQRVAGPQQRC